MSSRWSPLAVVECSRATLTYFGEPDAWGRNRAALEGAMTLFQMGDSFSSKELAGGTATVTLNRDYLAAYLATPFLGGEMRLVRTRERRRPPVRRGAGAYPRLHRRAARTEPEITRGGLNPEAAKNDAMPNGSRKQEE